MTPTQGNSEQASQPTRQGLPRLRDSVAFLARAFEVDNIPKPRRVVFNYDGHAGRPRDKAAYAVARMHGITVKDVHPVDVPLVRPVCDRQPMERSAARPRERARRGRSRVTRAGPSDDPPGDKPPGGSPQPAGRVASSGRPPRAARWPSAFLSGWRSSGPIFGAWYLLPVPAHVRCRAFGWSPRWVQRAAWGQLEDRIERISHASTGEAA